MSERARPGRGGRSLWVLVTVGALIATLFSATPAAVDGEAHAADASRFNPGNIISDQAFYNSGTMSADDIQRFLNGTRPSCDAGFVCLKDYRESFATRAADDRCGYLQGGSLSAAQIIYWVARACGINPQSLLVLLEKEQGLVSSARPSSARYRIAMGYGCPDTAPCDALFYGFFNQVYNAARQFQTYRLYPNSFGYRAGRNNTIQWHPDAACGASTVYIENQATAGLYNYTPYRPNAAALANLYGTGDRCSSYGNRNFWRIFSDWFGEPTIPVPGGIGTLWRALGGAASEVGGPTGYVVEYGVNGGGWAQEFSRGYIYESRSGNSAALRKNSGIFAAYAAANSQYGVFGWPRFSERCTGDRCVVGFDGGSIGWSPTTGVRQTTGEHARVYAAQGYDRGPLGIPTGAITTSNSNGGGATQSFSGGSTYSSSAGTYYLRSNSGLAQRYLAGGAQSGPLGWPTSSEECTGDACSIQFQNGVLGWTPATGIRQVDSSLLAAYRAAGGPASLGVPTGDLARRTGGAVQPFSAGIIYSSPSGIGALRSNSAIHREYLRTGDTAGPYGWPSRSELCAGAACHVEFQNAVIGWTSATGVRVVSGALLPAYRRAGSAAGVLGVPTSDSERYAANRGGIAQVFERGFAYAADGSGPVFLRGNSLIVQQYAALGSQNGRFGWPVGDEVCTGTVCSVAFQNGVLGWTPASGVQPSEGVFFRKYSTDRAAVGVPVSPVVRYPANGSGTAQDYQNAYIYSSANGDALLLKNSPITSRYAELGSQNGRLGWPRSDQSCTTTACSVEFQGGRIVQNRGDAAITVTYY